MLDGVRKACVTYPLSHDNGRSLLARSIHRARQFDTIKGGKSDIRRHACIRFKSSGVSRFLFTGQVGLWQNISVS